MCILICFVCVPFYSLLAEIPDHSSPEADKVEPQLQLEEGEAFGRGGPHVSGR